MSFLEKKINGIKRRMKCLSYGIFYLKAKDFRIPDRLRVNGKMRKIVFNNSGTDGFRYEFTEICLNDCYQLKKLKKHLPLIDTIVDIGANQGLFLIAARKNFPKASIGGYEPNPNIKELLFHNGEELNAEIYLEAVTNKDCMVDLQFGTSDLHTIAEPSATGTVQGKGLDKVIERAGGAIDILKLDCEGAEWELFRDKASWVNIRSVTMEYHLWARPGSTVEEVIDILNDLGFKVISNDRLSEQFGLIAAIKEN